MVRPFAPDVEHEVRDPVAGDDPGGLQLDRLGERTRAEERHAGAQHVRREIHHHLVDQPQPQRLPADVPGGHRDVLVAGVGAGPLDAGDERERSRRCPRPAGRGLVRHDEDVAAGRWLAGRPTRRQAAPDHPGRGAVTHLREVPGGRRRDVEDPLLVTQGQGDGPVAAPVEDRSGHVVVHRDEPVQGHSGVHDDLAHGRSPLPGGCSPREDRTGGAGSSVVRRRVSPGGSAPGRTAV